MLRFLPASQCDVVLVRLLFGYCSFVYMRIHAYTSVGGGFDGSQRSQRLRLLKVELRKQINGSRVTELVHLTLMIVSTHCYSTGTSGGGELR